MVGDPELPSVEDSLLLWAVSFQGGVIRDLAAAYGRADRDAALAMVTTLQRAFADDLIALRDKLPNRISFKLREVAIQVGDNLRAAKKAIEDATRPH